MPDIQEISSTILSTWLTTGDNIQLIDVREPHEREICHIGGQLIPLAQLPKQFAALDKTAKTVVYCRSGGRSRNACAQLLDAGFNEVYNLTGGVLAWSDEVDPSVEKY